MDKIISPIKNELDIFENNLKEVILKEDNFLVSDLEIFLFTKPKRLRPILIYLFAKILKVESAYVQDIALITELIHNASLIHDDIIDEEKQRRNNPTFYEKYGSKLAVLEGDLLLSLALEYLSKTTLEISKIFASKIKKTILGEINQNENLDKLIDIETYLNKTYAKTANLFMAGLEALFSLCKPNKDLINFLNNYTLAFQIKNDIDNFKNNATDFKNGNYTLPVIYFSKENNSTDFKEKKVEFQKCIEKSIDKVEELKQKAIASLNSIEDSQYKNALIKITDYTLSRS